MPETWQGHKELPRARKTKYSYYFDITLCETALRIFVNIIELFLNGIKIILMALPTLYHVIQSNRFFFYCQMYLVVFITMSL